MFESDSPSLQATSSQARSSQDRLFGRAWAILSRPARTWEVIAAEPFRPDIVYGRYTALLSALPPLCWLIGDVVFGHAAQGFPVHHLPVLAAIAGAVTWYIAGFIGIYVSAALVNLTLPAFGAQRDFASTFLLVAYAVTPVWLGGVFGLFPPLWWLGVACALYSVFLLVIGLPRLLAVPGPRLILCGLSAGVIVLAVMALAVMAGKGVAQGLSGVAGGAAVVNRGQAVAPVKPQAVAPAVSPRASPPVTPDPQALFPLLPPSFRGVPHQDETAVRGGAGAIASSTAGATYHVGSGLTLKVAIIRTLGGVDATAVMNVNSSSKGDVVTTVDGTMTEAVSDRIRRTAIYTIKTKDGVVITAQGNADLATLKALAETVDLKKAEALAK